MTVTYGSLFAGAGGVDLGFDVAGWSCRWQVEIDPTASAVLERHWPDVPKYGDVRHVNGDELEPVDVISGGFPCQDLSVAGKRAGLDGARSGLFYEFVRIVQEMRDATDGIRPRWIVWENVAGLLITSGALATVYARWDEVGAVVQEHRLVDGRYFGVPQRRRRVVGVVGFDPRSEHGPEVLAESAGVPRDSATVGQTRPGDSGGGAGRVGGGRLVADDGLVSSLTASFRFGPDAAHAQAGWLVPTSAGTLRARYWKGFNTTADDGGGPIVSPQGVRRLTPRECERLMGWPDDHTRYRSDGSEIADTHRYRMCGNGVIAPMAEWIARRITAVDLAVSA